MISMQSSPASVALSKIVQDNLKPTEDSHLLKFSNIDHVPGDSVFDQVRMIMLGLSRLQVHN